MFCLYIYMNVYEHHCLWTPAARGVYEQMVFMNSCLWTHLFMNTYGLRCLWTHAVYEQVFRNLFFLWTCVYEFVLFMKFCYVYELVLFMNRLFVNKDVYEHTRAVVFMNSVVYGHKCLWTELFMNSLFMNKNRYQQQCNTSAD